MPLLIQLFRRRFTLFLTVVALCGLTALITIWWNSQLSIIINSVSAGIYVSLKITAAALIILIINGVCLYFKNLVSAYLCELITHDLRMGYARHFTMLSIPEIENLGTGQEVSRLQNEIAEVSVYINSNLFQLIDDTVKFVFTLVWLLTLNSWLVFFANGPGLLILVYVFYSSIVISRATQLSQLARGRMNRHADSLLNLFPVIKLYNAEKMMNVNYNNEINEWERQTVKSELVQARLMSLSGVLSHVPLVLLFLMGGGMAVNGTLTVGTLYIFLNLSGNVSGVMMNMPGYIAAFRKFSANMKLLEKRFTPEAGNL